MVAFIIVVDKSQRHPAYRQGKARWGLYKGRSPCKLPTWRWKSQEGKSCLVPLQNSTFFVCVWKPGRSGRLANYSWAAARFRSCLPTAKSQPRVPGGHDPGRRQGAACKACALQTEMGGGGGERRGGVIGSAGEPN